MIECAINIFQSDGFDNINEYDFDLILSNPPYHADFNVPKKFIENGYYVFISQKRAIHKTRIKNKQKLSPNYSANTAELPKICQKQALRLMLLLLEIIISAKHSNSYILCRYLRYPRFPQIG